MTMQNDTTNRRPISDAVLDELMTGYEQPEDLLGDEGLFKELKRRLIEKALGAELKSINEALWEIEDDIRDEERNRRFGERFIELARAVYVTNDERGNAKKKINLHLKSSIVEEKSYQDYR